MMHGKEIYMHEHAHSYMKPLHNKATMSSLVVHISKLKSSNLMTRMLENGCVSTNKHYIEFTQLVLLTNFTSMSPYLNGSYSQLKLMLMFHSSTVHILCFLHLICRVIMS